MPSITRLRTSAAAIRGLCAALGFMLSAATLQAQQPVYRVLHSFDPGEGSLTAGPITQARDGLFYGANRFGGDFNHGTLFRMTPNGSVLVLHAFTGGDDGSSPGPLIEAWDGNLYGTTSEGGTYNRGVLFRMTPAGIVTVLHAFAGTAEDGRAPGSRLLQAASGDIYGTTCFGGASDRGTVFRVTDAGATPVYSFAGAADGDCPGGLLQASDGNLYGTSSGGVLGNGLAFRLTTGGTFSKVHDFVKAVEGSSPGPLLQSRLDGQFYGLAGSGGPFGTGTAFRIASSGALTVIHAFGDLAYGGTSPVGALVEGTDGQLYGATEYGGRPYSYFTSMGVVFRLSRQGAYSVIRLLRGDPDGMNPRAGLMQAADGHLYGTATGGFYGEGVVYRLDTYLCTNTIAATYYPQYQSLAFTFRFQSAAPGTWSMWAITSAGLTPLWSLPTGGASLPSGFGVTYNVAPLGPVLFVSTLDVPGFGSCGGFALVDTGAAGSTGAPPVLHLNPPPRGPGR